MTTTPRHPQAGGMSAISAAIRGALHGPVRERVGTDPVTAVLNEHRDQPCRGVDQPCGAPAGQSCEPSCSSWEIVRRAVPCEGADDLCGAPAGQLCQPWCPSWATDPS